MKNSALVIIGIILAVMVLVWLLKVTFKLVLLGAVVAVGIAIYSAVKNRIGGPRA